ncbi:HD domain-containing phosphohydrolase [Nocardia nepalensis]|uniref:HD domain-containing phosphohydrolase n=1 Tax=Nocardia nepalensis TaxID=3375448 RepID=UPI003B6827BB
MTSSGTDGTLRLVELLGAISVATDLGTGQPYSHAIRTSVLAVEAGRELGVAEDELADLQQVALLRFLGCTADAWRTAHLAGGDEIAFFAAMAPAVMGSKIDMARRLISAAGVGLSGYRRAALLAGALARPHGGERTLSVHCEVASRLAAGLGVNSAVQQALSHAYERWDGRGIPSGLAGFEIPLATRVAVVARDADIFWRADPRRFSDALRGRRGRGYDAAVVDACVRIGPEVLGELDRGNAWQAMLAANASGEQLDAARLDRALLAVAAFADLKSRWTLGHSAKVAELAAAAATAVGMTSAQILRLRRAGLVHDVGRVGVPVGIWDRPGPLDVSDWERVRMHPYLTERTLARCPVLADVGRLAGAHHERIDGSGYYRGTRDLDLPERLLGCADVVAAMGEERPYRAASSPAQVADAVRDEVRAGRLDRTAADAVLGVAGTLPVADRPAGLTDREVEVLVRITRGGTNQEVAADLRLSVKTVGRHIENIYAKIGVNSRAAAAVFAMQHRLLGH